MLCLTKYKSPVHLYPVSIFLTDKQEFVHLLCDHMVFCFLTFNETRNSLWFCNNSTHKVNSTAVWIRRTSYHKMSVLAEIQFINDPGIVLAKMVHGNTIMQLPLSKKSCNLAMLLSQYYLVCWHAFCEIIKYLSAQNNRSHKNVTKIKIRNYKLISVLSRQ